MELLAVQTPWFDDMSDKPTCGGWTVETLYEHVVQLLAAKETRDAERFSSQDKLTALALTAADKAVSKAENATEKRLEGLNEFRATLADQQALLITRNEAALLNKTLEARLSNLELSMQNTAGRSSGLHAGWLFLVGALGAIGSIGTLITFIRTFH